jgi:hypothetical protein
MEEWRQIKDNPNYSVSSFGNVRNDKTGRMLKPQRNNGDKYLALYLGRDNYKLIHRLVGQAFLEKSDEQTEIDHIDFDGHNNHLENLRWATRSQNEQHKVKRENCSSKYKGVCLVRSINKWRCRVHVNGKQIHVGYFDTEEECALAYNNYIKEQNLVFCIPNIL